MQGAKSDKYWLISGNLESPSLIQSNSVNMGRAKQLVCGTNSPRGRPKHRIKPQTKPSRECVIDELWQYRHVKQHSVYTRTQDMDQLNINQNAEVKPQVPLPLSSLKILERTQTMPVVRKIEILIKWEYQISLWF